MGSLDLLVSKIYEVFMELDFIFFGLALMLANQSANSLATRS